MINGAHDVFMFTLLIALAAVVGVGLLAVRYGVDSRHADPRDRRTSWV